MGLDETLDFAPAYPHVRWGTQNYVVLCEKIFILYYDT